MKETFEIKIKERSYKFEFNKEQKNVWLKNIDNSLSIWGEQEKVFNLLQAKETAILMLYGMGKISKNELKDEQIKLTQKF